MAEIRDNFIKTLDDSELGIGQDMNKLYCLLQVKDEEVYDDLVRREGLVFIGCSLTFDLFTRVLPEKLCTFCEKNSNRIYLKNRFSLH